MSEYPNDQGYRPPHESGGPPPGAPSQGGSWPGVPPGGGQYQPMAPLQPISPVPMPPPVPPAPAPVVHDAMPDSDGMYKEGIGWGLWCLWMFGLAGVHRIYMGKYGSGILWLLTWGLFGVGQFVDLFRMKALVREANIREGYLPHPRLAERLQAPASAGAASSMTALPPRQNVQQLLLKAAQGNGGALTVTQGVVTTGLTFEQVEGILRDMVAKGYVDVDNAPNSGVVVYRFPELAGPFN